LTILERLEPVVRQHLRFLDGVARIPSDQPLKELGLDSLGAINLLFEVEQAFEVVIPDRLLIESTFETLGSLTSVVERLLVGHVEG
jgi:acyl carrier protein